MDIDMTQAPPDIFDYFEKCLNVPLMADLQEVIRKHEPRGDEVLTTLSVIMADRINRSSLVTQDAVFKVGLFSRYTEMLVSVARDMKRIMKEYEAQGGTDAAHH